jgi:hypothetical protein
MLFNALLHERGEQVLRLDERLGDRATNTFDDQEVSTSSAKERHMVGRPT